MLLKFNFALQSLVLQLSQSHLASRSFMQAVGKYCIPWAQLTICLSPHQCLVHRLKLDSHQMFAANSRSNHLLRRFNEFLTTACCINGQCFYMPQPPRSITSYCRNLMPIHSKQTHTFEAFVAQHFNYSWTLTILTSCLE